MGVRVVFPDMGKNPSVQLIEKTITENGTYDAITDGANGYSKVNVNVEGGGSSDFSTARVTIVNNTNTEHNWWGGVAIEDEEGKFATPAITIGSGTNNYDVIMYGGFASVETDDSTLRGENISATGGVKCTFNSKTHTLDGIGITGDGTITIS